jgi:hypothetical protein
MHRRMPTYFESSSRWRLSFMSVQHVTIPHAMLRRLRSCCDTWDPTTSFRFTIDNSLPHITDGTDAPQSSPTDQQPFGSCTTLSSIRTTPNKSRSRPRGRKQLQ